MDQAKTLRNMADNKKNTKVIAVTSGKGGVGKTNVISNIAFLLTKSGEKVLLMDADLGLGNIDILLGLAPKYNVSHLLNGEKSLKEIIVKGPGGMDIIPATSGIQKITDLTETEKIQLLNEFDQMEEEYDYFLIDTGAGISKNVTYFCIASQEIVVIATPEPTSITDAYALMKVLAKNYGEHKFNLLVNMAKSKKEALQVFKTLTLVIEKYLGMDIALNYLGYVPYDEKFPSVVRNQKLIAEVEPESNAAKSFESIVDKIEKFEVDFNSKGNIQFFFNKLIAI
jgi:flagellar biosynthesis protein FlhG